MSYLGQDGAFHVLIFDANPWIEFQVTRDLEGQPVVQQDQYLSLAYEERKQWEKDQIHSIKSPGLNCQARGSEAMQHHE